MALPCTQPLPMATMNWLRCFLITAQIIILKVSILALCWSATDERAQGGEHGTPIKGAAFNQHDDVMWLLLECGADPDKGGPMPPVVEVLDF
jgi:hypothetical protein